MARRFCRAVVGLGVLYAVALGLFAFVRYRAGERPDVVGVARDFHGWVRAIFPRATPPPSDPGAVPPRRAPDPAPAPPTAPDPTRQPLIAPAGR